MRYPLSLILLLLATVVRGGETANADSFNFVLGTQTIGAAYQFTQEPRLIETAREIRAMGANVIKFRMSRDEPAKNSAITSLAELAARDPACKTVLDMPFTYYVIWTYPFHRADWHNGFPKESQEKEYREIYDFAAHLLKTYAGSGKSFYLGHWEGDWSLRGSGNTTDEEKVTPQAIQGMIDWLNVRQKAIEDAKRDVPHANVQIWHYTEVNRVDLSMKGKKTVANDVLPKTSIDFVSYSCYDHQRDPAKLKAALDYIESKLPPKAGFSGKRVFIGEYGFPAVHFTPEKQDAMSRQVMRAALEWGCPFALYWELYNNEIDKDGKQRGFWMINDKHEKQPIYFTHQRYYAWAKQFAAEFAAKNGRAPNADEFRTAALAWLDAVKP